MKKLIIFFYTAALVLTSCASKVESKEAKESKLKILKSELISLKGSIKDLEKELNASGKVKKALKIPVRVKTLTGEKFEHYIAQAGTVVSKQNVMVSSEMGGLVTNVLAKEGDWVSAKTTIISIDAEIMQKNVEELELAWELAKTTFERQKRLWDQEIGSELQFLQIKNQYLSLENKLASARAQLQKLNITAPISGTLEEVYVNPGELTRPGSPVFRIVNAEEVIVEADIAEKYANILKKNTPVTINFKSLGTSKNAKLDFIGQVINPDNRTFKVNIQLNNSNGILKPNAVASLEIRDFSSSNAIVVPSQIVKKDMRGDYLFVAKNGIAEKTYVSLGLSHSDQSMILEGLNLGDVIIVEGYNEVVSGSKLELKK